MFDEIRTRLPDLPKITSASPTYLQSAAFINGIKRQRCSWK